MTFNDLDKWTRSIARSLRCRGIAGGERVGLLLPHGPAYPVLLLSLLRAGAVAVPVSTRLPGSAVPRLVERIGCRRLITAAGARLDTGGDIEVIGAVDIMTADADGCRVEPPRPPQRQRGDEWIPPFHDRQADATIVFTSGSTGVPKAALHTFENHWASAAGANRNIPLRPGDRWLLSLPLWHVGGLAILFRCLLGGAAVAVAARDEPLAEAILGLGVTHVSLVSTQLYRLLGTERGRAALRSLEVVLLGGGPVPPALIVQASEVGARLVTSYGSTEMSSQTTATSPGDPPEALRTSGRRLAFRELSVGPTGEILVRGRTLFHGYVGESGVRAALDSSGWFPTGDLGHLDGNGNLVVTGRRDTMFISGGENIHPEEIEREILRFPGVLETIVVPAPDPEFGARPVAFVRTADGGLPGAAVLGSFLRQALPGIKIPISYLVWPDLAEGMKPDRHALAALARTRRKRAVT